MQSEKIAFANAKGQTLAARLDRPDGTPRAYALFAHCFTCDRGSKAAVRISRALAELGVATFRFDFSGLGESEGELSPFSSNIDDLVAAAAHMAAADMAPALLVGHSLGGAAVLAAASEIPSAKAVATIGAPGDPAHVLKLLGDGVDEVEREGQATVHIGGRPFTIDRAFITDARMQHLTQQVAALRRALLILHAPTDQIVGIENATEIFLSAKHPKSFVSLDTADHLLRRSEDADYAAGVIAAWASRYLGAAGAAPAEADDGAVHVSETGAGKFQVEVRVHGSRFVADEPVDVGGLGTGPSPYELVAAGLGACTAMTLRLYADRKGWPLKRASVAVKHDKVAGQTPADTFDRRITLEGPLNAEQTAKLLEIADKCPVHRTLEGGAKVVTASIPPAAPVSGDADEHFREMDEECRKDGAPA